MEILYFTPDTSVHIHGHTVVRCTDSIFLNDGFQNPLLTSGKENILLLLMPQKQQRFLFDQLTGNVIVNVVPLSTLLSNLIFPFIISMYRFTIFNPKPVPGILPVLCARKNASNKCF
jgi:hypothetical protein